MTLSKGNLSLYRGQDFEITIMNGNKIAESTEDRLQRTLREAARSDRFFAEDLLAQGRRPDALVHLARAMTYEPTSTLAAEMAVIALNGWPHSPLPAICLGHTDLVYTAGFSPDGKHILTASFDMTAKVWDARSGKLILTLRGHTAEINTARYSPDGRWIVTASEDTTARIWDAVSGQPVQTLQHSDEVDDARFAADGLRVLTGSMENPEHVVRIWEMRTGKSRSRIVNHNSVCEWQTSPDGGQLLTVCDDGSASIWDIGSGKLLTTLQHRVPLVSSPSPEHEGTKCDLAEMLFIVATFSADGRWIVTAAKDGIARIWDARTGELLQSLSGHQDEITNARFSLDGEWIVTASGDKTARVWSTKTGDLALTLKHPESVLDAQFSLDGLRIVTLSREGTARVWSAPTGTLLSAVTFQGCDQIEDWKISTDGDRVLVHMSDHTIRVFDVSEQSLGKTLRSNCGNVLDAHFSPDGRRLLTSHSTPVSPDSESLRFCEEVWDVDSGKLLATLDDASRGGSFSPDSRRLIAPSSEPDEKVSIWETDTGRLHTVLRGHEGIVLGVAFSPDGRQVATSSEDRTIRLWDSETGQLEAILPKPACEGSKYLCPIIHYSPDGNSLLTVSQGTAVYVWSARTGQLLLTLDGQEEQELKSLTWSPDSKRVALGSEDRTAKIWDATNGQRLTTIDVGDMPQHLQFDPEGKHILIVTWNDVRAWDAATGARIYPGNRYEKSVSWGQDISLSRDGRRAVTMTAGDKTAWMWDVERGKRLVCLRGHEDEVTDAEFSPDGRLLATISFDGTVRLWELLATSAPPPLWFADFLRLMAQRKFNDDGELVPMSAEDILSLRDQLERIVAAEHSRYAAIARHFLAPATLPIKAEYE